MAKWTFDGIELSRNPIVWQPSHDYSQLEQEIVFDDGRIGRLRRETPSRALSIQCAFDKLPVGEKQFLESLQGKEFWIISDVAGEEWKVRIANFAPAWNMKGPTEANRAFDVAMDLRCTWPYQRTAVVNGPTARNDAAEWTITVAGNEVCWNLEIEISNNVTNPKITNVTTGKSCQYTGSLGASTLKINMLNRWATLGSTDCTHLISEFFPLAKGTNTIKYNGSAQAQVKLTWYPCFV